MKLYYNLTAEQLQAKLKDCRKEWFVTMGVEQTAPDPRGLMRATKYYLVVLFDLDDE